jgi:hypothetical protein
MLSKFLYNFESIKRSFFFDQKETLLLDLHKVKEHQAMYPEYFSSDFINYVVSDANFSAVTKHVAVVKSLGVNQGLYTASQKASNILHFKASPSNIMKYNSLSEMIFDFDGSILKAKEEFILKVEKVANHLPSGSEKEVANFIKNCHFNTPQKLEIQRFAKNPGGGVEFGDVFELPHTFNTKIATQKIFTHFQDFYYNCELIKGLQDVCNNSEVFVLLGCEPKIAIYLGASLYSEMYTTLHYPGQFKLLLKSLSLKAEILNAVRAENPGSVYSAYVVGFAKTFLHSKTLLQGLNIPYAQCISVWFNTAPYFKPYMPSIVQKGMESQIYQVSETYVRRAYPGHFRN